MISSLAVLVVYPGPTQILSSLEGKDGGGKRRDYNV